MIYCNLNEEHTCERCGRNYGRGNVVAMCDLTWRDRVKNPRDFMAAKRSKKKFPNSPNGKRPNVPEKNIVEKTLSFAKAATTGVPVSDERMNARLDICSTCIFLQVDSADNLRCGVCRCPMSNKPDTRNLIRYEETPSYGCKFEDPDTGEKYSKWKAAGV
jgi:hypothetical protein